MDSTTEVNVTRQTRLANARDVDMCYQLILGRRAENAESAAKRFGQPIDVVLRGMLKSKEFENNIHQYIKRGEWHHGYRNADSLPDAVFWFCDTIKLTESERTLVSAAASWSDLLHVLININQYASFIPMLNGTIFDEFTKNCGHVGLNNSAVPVDDPNAAFGDVENCYQILLGRTAENIAVVNARVGQKLDHIVCDMLSSKEFASKIDAYLASGELPHSKGVRMPIDRAILWITKTLRLSDKDNKAILESETWSQLLKALVDVPKYIEQLSPELAENLSRFKSSEPVTLKAEVEVAAAHSALAKDKHNESRFGTAIRPHKSIECNIDYISGNAIKGWAIDRLKSACSVVLTVTIDGIFVQELNCNLFRSDLRDAGYYDSSGFKFEIPETYLDNRRHLLTFSFEGERVWVRVDGKPLPCLAFQEGIAPQIHSHVDGFDQGAIKGWVLVGEKGTDRQLKGGAVVLVTCNGEHVDQIKANRHRPDVAQSLAADPYCGFLYDPPPQLKRSYPQKFQFFLMPNEIELTNSPCTASFSQDHRQGKMFVLKESIERINRELESLRQQVKSLTEVRHFNVGDYDQWARNYLPALRKRVERDRAADTVGYAPLVSVICPTYKPRLPDFVAAVESVIAQTYQNWELLIIDDASNSEILDYQIEAFASRDTRIRSMKTTENSGISGATNAAIAAARGEWIALFDHDDLLVDVALESMVRAASKTGAKMVYSDEDKVDESGYFVEPAFKPDWNYRFLLSCNYVCHLLMVRADLLAEVGPPSFPLRRGAGS